MFMAETILSEHSKNQSASAESTTAFPGIYPEFRQLRLRLLLPQQALLDLMLGDLALNNRGQR